MLLVTLALAVAVAASSPQSRHPVPHQSPEEVVAAGTALVQRVVPEHAAQITVQAIACDGTSGNEVLEYEAAQQLGASDSSGSTQPVLTLRGCTGVAIASALQWYLRDEVGNYSAPSWASLPPVRGLPKQLPAPQAKHRLARPVRFSWYSNVCTPSYSFAWWDWGRWEKEIDLMAMHGVNIMYAHTGAEYVQAKVWRQLLGANATRGIADFYSGPAFLAWFRMGNLKKWGGPMPSSFLEQQNALQLRILPRLQSLGIIGVLPAFAGFVPDALKYARPNAAISPGSQWMTGVSWLDPSVTGSQVSGVDVLQAQDPLFTEIGRAFLDGYRKEYGTVNYTLQHYYSADTFNGVCVCVCVRVRVCFTLSSLSGPVGQRMRRRRMTPCSSRTTQRQRTKPWRRLIHTVYGWCRLGRLVQATGRTTASKRISLAFRTPRCSCLTWSRIRCLFGMASGQRFTTSCLRSAAVPTHLRVAQTVTARAAIQRQRQVAGRALQPVIITRITLARTGFTAHSTTVSHCPWLVPPYACH